MFSQNPQQQDPLSPVNRYVIQITTSEFGTVASTDMSTARRAMETERYAAEA